jgi:hypothetical protein
MAERIASRCICCESADLGRSPAILMPFVANRVFGWTPVEITPEWGLRTIRTGMAYPLCASLQCQDCGVLLLDIRFSDAEMAALYSGYRDETYTAQRDRFEPGYAAQNAAILTRAADSSWMEAFLAPSLPPAPRVLDWGGDTGMYAPFRSAGAAIDVFDISDQPLVEGVRRVGKDDLVRGGYDLIVLSHVLEHVPWPADMIGEIAAVMDQTTVLYLEVPYESLVAADPLGRDLAAKKKHWHEHINFFTETGLRALLARCGLDIAEAEVRTTSSLASFTQVLSLSCRLANA